LSGHRSCPLTLRPFRFERDGLAVELAAVVTAIPRRALGAGRDPSPPVASPGRMTWLKRLLFSWVFNIAAIFVASVFIDGIDYSDDFWILVLAGLVFGLVNAILKPIVRLLALPLVILTLGVVLFFINLLMLYIASWIVPGFSIDSFWSAVWATIIIWAVNWTLNAVFDVEDSSRRG
jgi:putative membrane protein